ncbi:MAG: hypothetical protein NWQ13_05690, partial [Glaciimonas sp.]|nr:hypothetical protein [Glaciimonas sp.]
AITSPTSITKWKRNDKQPVSWHVAGTAQAPISCRNVRIDLSIDGGHTYLAQPLLASTPNTGRAQVKIPPLDQDISKARIRVGCNGNLFFAISPDNFTIVK